MGLFPLDCPVDVAIAVWEWGAYLGDEGKQRGVRGKVASFRRISSDSVIPAAKATGQYVNSVLAKIEVAKAGYEEAILLDDRGMVCEGSGENLFFVKDGVIATPGFSADILGGINRASIDHDRARPRLHGRRARRRARRALPRRRDLHDRDGGRADARCARSTTGRSAAASPARSRARSSACSRTRCTAARSATRNGWTSSPRRRRRDVSRIAIYDCTLRDGMQGEGMSLSAAEKLRVAHVLDELGVPLSRRASPPRTRRRPSCSSCSRARRSERRRSPRSA